MTQRQYLEIDADGFAVALYNNRSEPPTVTAAHAVLLMETPIPCLPDGATPTQRQKWAGAALEWVETGTLDQLREHRIEQLRAECQARIFAGFSSAALGESHTYPANITDQSNLIGSVADSLMPGIPPEWSTAFWCSDVAGVWKMRAHSASQIQQAGRDGKAAILAALTTNETLRKQVMQAQTAEEVAAIGWPNA